MRFSSKRAIAHTDCPTIPVESGNNKSRVTPYSPCHGRNSHLTGSIRVKASRQIASRANLAVPSPDRSQEMLQMREELASLDVVRRQAMATAWVQALSGKGDM
ncbi:hypothetical protein FH972_015916 [Carpinus fangiana]|uniref:Uncharacterized protein n=1 Tax=Carpinus fangiana TaxID=176857 RepID=A0A5N6RFF7_9ROSI|nr:hypothetical protein FH972_015916 [Carpinus fangiana]